MTRPDFPSNSNGPERGGEPKKVERVVTSEVKVQPKSLGKRLKQALIGGDSKTVLQHVIVEVLVPQAKDMIAEALTQGFNRFIYGDDRSSMRRRPSGYSAGHTNYNRYSSRGNNPIGRATREDRPTISLRHDDLEDLVFQSRHEAEAVLEQLNDILEEYDVVTVADLYASFKETSPKHTDNKWGWENLQGAYVKMVRGGYLLSLPQPRPLD